MLIYYILAIVAGLIVITLLGSGICFYLVFYSRTRKVLGEDEFELPPGRIYEPFHEQMTGWMREIRTAPHKDLSITSFDGLTLRGKYYECQAGAPLEILFHGYRGTAERDLCGAVRRCFALGRNALIVDQRAGGTSDGHVISFGINERRDCLDWINFAIETFGKDVKIIITGISMGASTVLMASGEQLPSQVICVLADCGFSSAKEIIQKIMKDMHLPRWPIYPLIKLGARLFGRFDLEETSPMEAMSKCRVPIIFFHGETDNFVPCEMSVNMYKACASPHKKLVLVPHAGHGLAYPINIENYLNAVREFEQEYQS